jgi:hypothetical protein
MRNILKKNIYFLFNIKIKSDSFIDYIIYEFIILYNISYITNIIKT